MNLIIVLNDLNHVLFSTYDLTCFHEINIYITKKKIMRNLLYFIAVLLVIGWAIGFFVYSLGSIIHILLVIAIIAILLNIIRGGQAT